MNDRTTRRSIRFAAAAGVLAVALAIGSGPARAQDASTVEGHPMIGSDAPAFELETVTGETVTLAGLRGNYVVIHFGASW